MLKNKKYHGIYDHKGEVFTNINPKIVEREIFDAVREKAKKNEHGSRSVKTVYLLRHKVRCGYCGGYISAESGTAHNGGIRYYYKCLNMILIKNAKLVYKRSTTILLIDKNLRNLNIEEIFVEYNKNKNINYQSVNLRIKTQDPNPSFGSNSGFENSLSNEKQFDTIKSRDSSDDLFTPSIRCRTKTRQQRFKTKSAQAKKSKAKKTISINKEE